MTIFIMKSVKKQFILSEFCRMNNRNACLEITCRGLEWYMEHYIDIYIEAGWKIYWIYPYTNDLSTLFTRNLELLKTEFKIVTKKFILDCHEAAKKKI